MFNNNLHTNVFGDFNRLNIIIKYSVSDIIARHHIDNEY